MFLNTVPARFNPDQPISFVDVLGQRHPCYYPKEVLYDAEKTHVEVMFLKPFHQSKSGKFAGFRVRCPGPDDYLASFLPFTKIGRVVTAEARVRIPNADGTMDEQTCVISPGVFRDFVITEPEDPFKRTLCWVRKIPDNELLRLEGVAYYHDLNVQAMVESVRFKNGSAS